MMGRSFRRPFARALRLTFAVGSLVSACRAASWAYVARKDADDLEYLRRLELPR